MGEAVGHAQTGIWYYQEVEKSTMFPVSLSVHSLILLGVNPLAFNGITRCFFSARRSQYFTRAEARHKDAI